jgi:hypothetical protein
MDFVAGKREQINRNTRTIYRDFADRLHRIRMHCAALLLDLFCDLGNGKNNTRFVVGPHKRYQRIPVNRALFQCSHVEQPVFVNADFSKTRAAFGQRAAAIADGRMLDRRGNQTGLRAVPSEKPLYRAVIAFRTAAGENYFGRIGVQQSRDLFARPVDMFFYHAAETVNTRRIAIGVLEKREHGVKNFRRYAGCRIIIKIDCVRISSLLKKTVCVPSLFKKK